MDLIHLINDSIQNFNHLQEGYWVFFTELSVYATGQVVQDEFKNIAFRRTNIL